MSKICAIQLPTLSMSESRIDYYIKVAKNNGASLVLLGEYVLNSFFTELKKMPKSMIKEQSEHKKSLMGELAKKYEITIVAPLILVKPDGFLKVCAKFSPNSFKTYEQKILMNYPHWNEDELFASSAKEDNFELGVFMHEKFKLGVMFGFESHFDICWQYFMSKKVDCVLLPTACTFDSNKRWEELLKTRAFTNSMYILRANRVGKTKFDDINFGFYGDSFMVAPNGEIADRLREEEGMLLYEISKKEINLMKNIWKFRDILAKKELI